MGTIFAVKKYSFSCKEGIAKTEKQYKDF